MVGASRSVGTATHASVHHDTRGACLQQINESWLELGAASTPRPLPLAHALQEARSSAPGLMFVSSVSSGLCGDYGCGAGDLSMLRCALIPSVAGAWPRRPGEWRATPSLQGRVLSRPPRLPQTPTQWSGYAPGLMGERLERSCWRNAPDVWVQSPTQFLCWARRHSSFRLDKGSEQRSGSQPRNRPRFALQCAWVEQRATIHVEAPRERVFAFYRDLDAMPQWSPWLRAVRVDARDPHLTHWTLAAKGLEFTWQARMVSVEPPKRIVWESVHGLPNRGQVMFRERSEPNVSTPSTWLEIELAFELPAWAARWFHNAPWLQGFVERTLRADLERFRAYVQQRMANEKLMEPF
ncbi:hypothetical protein CCYA_CCYA17G4285 [Cyanidiococcus yangmingshanensis]|nr:hypothetical protein CCYA_CCYA17G4285 [Cyanidiococcus yangmingshanensis]